MANNDAELNRLRAEVRKRHYDATKKISRIRRVNNVEIGSTQHDPRRDINNVIKRYNRAQLQSYLSKLNDFQSRSTNFVRGAEGVPIPSATWKRYQALERKYNAIGKKHVNNISNIKLPTTNMTIGEREVTMKPKGFVRPGVEPTQRPFNQMNRKPDFIRGEKALEKLIRQMENKTSKGYLPKTLKDQRKQLSEAAKVIGDSDLSKMAKSLTDDQFNVVWNYSNFASQIGAIYFIQKSRATTGNEKRWYASVYEDYINDAKEILEWAGSIKRAEFTDTRARAVPIQGQARSPRRRRR